MYNVQFTEVFIRPKYPKSIYVEWVLSNPSLPDNYFFDVFMSDSPETNYEKINSIPIVNSDTFEFPFSLTFKEEYVWIKVVLTIGGQVVSSKPQGLYNRISKQEFLVVQEIIRKNNLIRNKKIGNRCFIRKRRTFGKQCNRCTDRGSGVITDSKCPVCYGTRIIGGYFDPIEAFCEIVEGQRTITPSEIGTIENISAMANLSYPIVQKGDVVIEDGRNKRWYVNVVQRQTLKTFPIDQKLELRQISAKDIEYQL